MAGPVATAELMTAVFAPVAARATEVCAILYLDADRRLVGARHLVGGLGTLDLSPRTIVADALAFGAARVVMAHNHPSGDPTPSEGDRAFTRQLARGLDAVDVRLGDHLILTADASTSMRAGGAF